MTEHTTDQAARDAADIEDLLVPVHAQPVGDRDFEKENIAESLVRAEARIETLVRERDQGFRERDQAFRARHSALSALESFKRQVRTVALRVRQEENWCVPGFNQVMDELGLAVLPTRIEAELELVVTRRVKVVIDENVDDLLDEDGDIDEDAVLFRIRDDAPRALEADDEREPELDDVTVISTEAADD